MAMTAVTISMFQLTIANKQSVEMPEGARILQADMLHDRLYLWAIINPTKPVHPRTIRIYGTGHPMEDDPGRYIGTFMVQDGTLVFHVFDGGDERYKGSSVTP